MTQKDIELKVAMRRLFWRIGYSTRINVPLRAYVPSQARAASFEEYTDLDVLGIAVGRDVRLERVIADCKTSDRGSTERMFWLKGVSYFFNSDTAYLVRQETVTRAARQLASKLDLSIITASDFLLLEEYHPGDSRIDWDSIDPLLDSAVVRREDSLLRNVDKKLQRLVDFCRYDFWGYEPYRNVFQLVAQLTAIAKHLKIDNVSDLVLFADCVWLYSVALAFAVEYARRSRLSEISDTLQEYVFGGQLGLLEKRRVFTELAKINDAPKSLTVGMLPEYFPLVLELVMRLSRRPNSINDVLRYGEIIRLSLTAGRSPNLKEMFGTGYDEIASKLLGDVAGALVSFSGIDATFRVRYRKLISGVSPTEKSDAAAYSDTAKSSTKSTKTEIETQNHSEPSLEQPGINRDDEPLRLLDP